MISPRPWQVGQVVGPLPGSRARSLAAVASLHARDLDLGGQAEHRLFEGDFQIVADVFAALRAVATRAAASPPNRSPKPKKSPRMSPKSAKVSGLKPWLAGALHAGMAVAIVGGALLRVAQNAVGLGGFFEFLLGVGIVRIAIRVVLQWPACGKRP